MSKVSSISNTVVVDVGSYTIKAGLSGDAAPRTFSTRIINNKGQRSVLVGNADSSLVASCPVVNGVVVDWEGMEQIWNHVFSVVLDVVPSEHIVLVAEPALSKDRERLSRMLFDTFGVPAVYFGASAGLALYACKLRTGLVIDIGHDTTVVTPVVDGVDIQHATRRMSVGGRDLVDYMTSLLRKRGQSFTSPPAHEVAAAALAHVAFVAADFGAEEEGPETDVPCHEGSAVLIGHERFRCPEALFQPLLMGREEPGIHMVAFNAAAEAGTDVAMFRSITANVVVVGGPANLPGLVKRVAAELTAVCEAHGREHEVAAVAGLDVPPERLAWTGGARLTANPIFESLCLTREEYEEEGEGALGRKFVGVFP